MTVELRRVDDIVIRKLATFCRTLSFATSVKVEGRGDSNRRVIVMETKDRDIVEIAAVTLPTRVTIDGVENVKPTIVENNTMYAPLCGFPKGVSDKEVDTFIKSAHIPKDLISKQYRSGTVVYKKTRYQ